MITVRNLIVCLLALAFSIDALAAGLVARLDRTRVAEGDAVVLTLATSGDSDGLPDLTPLQKDFDLINQGHSTHMRIVNGRSSSSREWHLTLMPKRTGKIEIPPIKFGNSASVALTLEVLPAAQAAKQGMPRPVFVEVEAQPEKPYVQQKVIYTVRLLFAVPLRDAQLSEPRIGDAIVERLGDEQRYDTQRDGQSFQVVERRYAVLPQHSGPLAIGGPLLTARVPEPQQRGNSLRDRFFGRDPFAGLGALSTQTRPIQLRGQDLTVEVQPQPAGTPTPWLPAESLSLNDAWSPNPPEFRVGEPLTRTIAITAQGLAGAQLPDLELVAPPGVKFYPDQARADTRPDKDTLVAQKLLKVALVPARAGSLTLPEISLSWWNTAKGELEVARLPAREVQVLPAPAGSTAGQLMPDSGSIATAARPASAQPGLPMEHGAGARATDGGWSGSRDESGDGLWLWIAVLFAAAWLVSTLLWLRARVQRVAPPAPPVPANPAVPAFRPGRPLAEVERAFRGNDPHAAREALLDWARGRWSDDPPLGLETLAERLGRQTLPVMQELDRRLYAGDTGDWDGAAAWTQLAEALNRPKGQSPAGTEGSALPPLYPSGA